MTVSELRERLQGMEAQGCGSCLVETWDPDMEEWATITVMTYGKEQPVRLYTDEP